MKNVVEFPKSKIVREVPHNIEAIEQAKERGLQKFAEEVVDDMIDNLLHDLDSVGVETEGDTFRKDFSLTIDALRATVYRSFNLQHHMHEFIDRNIKMMNKKTGELIEEEVLDSVE